MSNVKTYRKKLTNSGCGSRILAFFALIFAGVGCAWPFVAKLVYSIINDGKNYPIENIIGFRGNEILNYIGTCAASITVAVISLVLFIGLLNGSKKMCIDSFAINLTVFSGIAVMVFPVCCIISFLFDNSLMKKLGNSFTVTCSFINYVIPVASAFFILLSGLALAGKISDDYIEVTIPLKKNLMRQNSESMNQQNNFQNYPQNNQQVGFAAPVSDNTANTNNTVMQETADNEDFKPQQEQNVDDNNNDTKAEPAFAEIPQPNVQKAAVNSQENVTDTDNISEIPQTPQQPAVSEDNLSESEHKEENICRNCMTTLKPDAKFCPVCGTKVE